MEGGEKEEEEEEEEEYVICRGVEEPRPWLALLRLPFPIIGDGELKSSPSLSKRKTKSTWQSRVSNLILCLLMTRWVAFVFGILRWGLEVVPNMIRINFLSLLGMVKEKDVPLEESSKYLSIVSLIDWRQDLAVNIHERGALNSNVTMANLCVMASKLSYENEQVIRSVVTKHWNMHLIKFYSFWNDRLQDRTTQAFLFADSPQNANMAIVAFRGTQPFDPKDWSTDFDFSWYMLPRFGRVHIGFIEALGLANRNELLTFKRLQQCSKDNTNSKANTSKLPFISNQDESKPLAFHNLANDLLSFIKKNPRAKIYITGHSLGGALAILFPSMLLYIGNEEILSQLDAIYTFGQPRVGDKDLGNFVQDEFMKRNISYYRVVYNNDLVPQVPPNDPIFGFKHFGLCFYINTHYQAHVLKDQPNNNLFSPSYIISARLSAIRELFLSLFRWMLYGLVFWENPFSILVRFIGVVFSPQISDHSLVNYVNALIYLSKSRNQEEIITNLQ